MSSLEIAILIAGLAAIAVIAFFLLRTLWQVRHMQLMRCPETGTIVFVGAECLSRGDVTTPRVTVRSCELWPERKYCARGCLERYKEAASGYPINVEALRPFERRP